MSIKNPNANEDKAGKEPDGTMSQHFPVHYLYFECRIDKIKQNKPHDHDNTD
jgi:hypothetical protein